MHYQDIYLTEYRHQGVPMLSLGTQDSWGNEALRVSCGPSWEGLALRCTWRAGEAEAMETLVNAQGIALVPPEATAAKGYHWLVIDGTAEGRTMISHNIRYFVQAHQPVGGGQPEDPTPSMYQQFVNEVKDDRTVAEQKAQEARLAQQNAELAASRSPMIQQGTWWVWAADEKRYVDTGISASGGEADESISNQDIGNILDSAI